MAWAVHCLTGNCIVTENFDGNDSRPRTSPASARNPVICSSYCVLQAMNFASCEDGWTRDVSFFKYFMARICQNL